MIAFSPGESLLIAGVIVTLAYTVFGLTGFGASIVGLPFLAQLYPLRVLVPSMLTFDLCAALLLGLKNRAHVERREIVRLIPFILVGMAVGVTVLSHAPERWLMLVLGSFILAYAAWSLFARGATRHVSTAWSAPAGVVGGAFTALYGTGGPVYTIYLVRRLADKASLRATIGVVVLFTALTRLVLFAATGLLLQAPVLELTLSLLPGALLGYALGSRLHGAISGAAAARTVWTLLIVGAVGMLWRGLNR